MASYAHVSTTRCDRSDCLVKAICPSCVLKRLSSVVCIGFDDYVVVSIRADIANPCHAVSQSTNSALMKNARFFPLEYPLLKSNLPANAPVFCSVPLRYISHCLASWLAQINKTIEPQRIIAAASIDAHCISFEMFCIDRSWHFSRSLLIPFSFQLSARQNFNLVLPAFRRVLAPSVDRLAGFELQRLFQGDLRAEVFDCV